MVFYCANYYADPRCVTNVSNFGDFCTECLQSKRGWSVEVLDGRGDSGSGSGSSPASPNQSSSQASPRESAALPRDPQQALRNPTAST